MFVLGEDFVSDLQTMSRQRSGLCPVMERYTERLMGFWLLLHSCTTLETDSESYIWYLAQKVKRSKGIIASSLAAEPLVHLPPSFRSNKHRTRDTLFEGSVPIRPSITHIRNSLALNLTCSSSSLDRPAALGRHTLDLVVAALVVKAFGYADIVTSTAIPWKSERSSLWRLQEWLMHRGKHLPSSAAPAA